MSEFDSDFDRAVARIQQVIDQHERSLYSEQTLKEAYHPRNVGRMAEPDGEATVRGWCGDTMEFYIRLDGDRIDEITFWTDGCGPTVACGSMLTSMVGGESLEDVLRVTPQHLEAALNGLPEESAHCAELAVKTLHQAVADYEAANGARNRQRR
ncbi:MAG: iron-sulfur cluster assembly scaffold protein [Anaerolineae bacterium]|jgi:nitrogen fixation NifU-like protein